MKRLCFIFIISLLMSYSLICQEGHFMPGETQELRQQIQTEIHNQISANQNLGMILNVDSCIGLGWKNDYPPIVEVSNPYGTLTNCIIFVTTLQGYPTATDSAAGVIGIFKNGNIIWHSDGAITVKHDIFSGDIWAVKDINNDGKIEILVNWYAGMSPNGLVNLWIVSWDGTQGKIINDRDENGLSTILTSSTWDFNLADVEGDGVWEIQGAMEPEFSSADTLRKIPQSDYALYTYSWNGTLYGRWPSTPQPLYGASYPRNKAQVDVNALIRQNGNTLEYDYKVHSLNSSIQFVEEFAIDRLVDSVIFLPTRKYWEGTLPWIPVIDWQCYAIEGINYIQHGETEPNFSFTTVAPNLSKILKFYSFGLNKGVSDAKNESLDNSFKGFTIGPTDPPNPFVPLNFLDTLISFTTRSHDLGWIKQQPISDKYTGYFSTAKTALQKNKISLTHSTLTQALHDVDVDSSSTLTSEAYALIKYNTEYLLAHLPNTISALDMLDTLRVRTDRTIPNNTPCGRDFKEDLIENIAKAKKELIEKDTIACALYIKMYEKQICEKYNHRKGKPCVTTDEYNYLYPYAESIVELLLPLPPKCGGSCKDKLFDLKSEIGRCTKKGYCSRGEFENGMEEQIDKAVKCIENKDSTGTATCLGLFEQEVQQTYEQTKKRYDERKYVKPEGYITLYYKAEYILEDLEH